MHMPSRFGHTHQLGEDFFHVWHQLDHMPVGNQVKGLVGQCQRKRISDLELEAGGEGRVFGASVFDRSLE